MWAGKAEDPQKGWALGQGAGTSSGSVLGTSGAKGLCFGGDREKESLAAAALTLVNMKFSLSFLSCQVFCLVLSFSRHRLT